MQRVLAAVVAALVVAAISGLAIVEPPEPSTDTAGPDNQAVTTTPATLPPLTEGRARVTGKLTGLTATGAGGGPVGLPLILTMPNPGGGRVRIPAVDVDGRTQTIEWNGGQPLPVSGRGGLDIDGTTVVVDGSGISWSLDGAPRFLVPGIYALGSTVAVGGEGGGTARDAVTFRAAEGDGLESSGGVKATASPRGVRIESPAGTLQLAGGLTVETVNVSRPLSTLHFGPGRYVVELTPAPGGYTIVAALEGQFGPGG